MRAGIYLPTGSVPLFCMHKKLHISRWLMFISVLIIVVFQAYWLKRVYNDTYRNLRREISVELREAFLKQQIQSIAGDTAVRFIRRDTVGVHGSQLMLVRFDSMDAPMGRQGKDSAFRMEIHTGRPGTANGNVPLGPPRVMAIEPAQDDFKPAKHLLVSVPLFDKDFTRGASHPEVEAILKEAGLPWQFVMRESDIQAQGHIRIGQNRGWMGRRNVHMVFADLDFGSALPLILRKMWLQVALALFMTGMIILAFRFMYKSLREQQQMASLKNDFISNMTHELKTPIATVSVALEALKNFGALDNPGRTKEYLDISSAELNRLSMLVDKVLRINLFEADKLDLNQQSVDLVQLTREVVQAQQLQAEKTGGRIYFSAPEETCVVTGDRLHLMSVLYNLLDNALKYRNNPPVIQVSLNKRGNDIRWVVQDNGPGIAAEYKDRIFEKFFRVPQGDRHDAKGYGLGLSYVHEVVQKHGGTITVDSEPGKGCTFTVTLPAQNGYT